MILAAGRGERLKPITDTLPKPLIPIFGKSLIIYHLEKLAQAGFKEIIINLSYLGDKIEQYLGNGSAWNLNILYSYEKDEALETGGGIVKALPLLGHEPFVTINADIFTDFDFGDLALPWKRENILAHLILVPNKPYHSGDFSLKDNLVKNDFPRPYTVSGISLYRPDFFANLSQGKYSVAPLWRKYADEGKVSGSVFHGVWHDIGTLERLQALENSM